MILRNNCVVGLLGLDCVITLKSGGLRCRRLFLLPLPVVLLFMFQGELAFLLVARENVANADTVLIHPGETLYVTFQRSGDSLTIAHVGKDRDNEAQLVLTMAPLKEIRGTSLKVENKFDKNLYYKAEIHLLLQNKKTSTSVVPVRAGKMSFESWPYVIEELALSGFEIKGK